MPRTILIVDDSASCLETLEFTLMPLANVQVRTASSARDALTQLDNGSSAIDMLITDLDLRRMDGFELIEHVRRQPRFHALPIVVISGDCDPRTPERLRRLGVNSHIAKPYSPSEVRQILEQFLNVRE